MRKLKFHLISLIFYSASLFACFYWYDWKFFLIIFLFVAANNLSNSAEKF